LERHRRAGGHRLFTTNDREPTGFARFSRKHRYGCQPRLPRIRGARQDSLINVMIGAKAEFLTPTFVQSAEPVVQQRAMHENARVGCLELEELDASTGQNCGSPLASYCKLLAD
jgi:hypothetical protein